MQVGCGREGDADGNVNYDMLLENSLKRRLKILKRSRVSHSTPRTVFVEIKAWEHKGTCTERSTAALLVGQNPKS